MPATLARMTHDLCLNVVSETSKTGHDSHHTLKDNIDRWRGQTERHHFKLRQYSAACARGDNNRQPLSARTKQNMVFRRGHANPSNTKRTTILREQFLPPGPRVIRLRYIDTILGRLAARGRERLGACIATILYPHEDDSQALVIRQQRKAGDVICAVS